MKAQIIIRQLLYHGARVAHYKHYTLTCTMSGTKLLAIDGVICDSVDNRLCISIF